MNSVSTPPDPRRAPTRTWSLRRLLAIGALAAYFVLGVCFLVVREVVIPRVEAYRTQAESALGRALGLPVSIEVLSADWRGLRPRLHLAGLSIRDRDGRPALRLDKVDAVLSWSSLLRGQPNFYRLELRGPELALRRDEAGQVYVAGIALDTEGGGGGFSDWLLAQREILVRDARLAWTDALRGAPELRLEGVDFRLLRIGGRYRFGLRAEPPAALASALDLRGDLVSTRPGDPDAWAGQLYLALDRADPGGWQPWVDYPVELAGSGGLRAWLAVEGGETGSLAARLSLADVSTRLAEGLPVLRLASMSGWLSGRRWASGLEFSARRLELSTAEGLAMAPTDIDLALRGIAEGRAGEGQVSANRLDLAVLAAIAAHLPFDALRDRLAVLAPRGRVDDLRLAWAGGGDAPPTWKVRARVADLGLAPEGGLPGVSGLSGQVEGDQRAGRFRLAGQDAVLDLPAVFPESRLAFAALAAEGAWGHRDGRLEVVLENASFENADAAGSASGRYLPAHDGPGEIDLSARLTRAQGQAVWRYLPHAVNEHTRSWVRRGITSGVVPEARLRLKGDLADFPFREPDSGQFLVTARVSGASLDYAPGWPGITGIDGELRFEGPAMRVSAERGRIFGVDLAGVTADVPDLHALEGEEIMTIRGRAAGPTAEFLRFVSESPIAGRIHGFTDHMRAEGRGNLDLTLVMPLRHVRDTSVTGEYRFAGNRLQVVDGLPPLADAAGALRFTEERLLIPEARAKLFGEPMLLSAEAAQEGGVRFKVTGGASVRALRQTYDWPTLDHLSGTAGWTAAIEMRGGATTVSLQSDLGGLASSLPEPLNKRAGVPWPLEARLAILAGGEREELRVELPERAALELVRRRSGSGWAIERGGLALSAPFQSAEGGLQLSVAAEHLDVDAWRRVLEQDEGGADASESADASAAAEASGASGALAGTEAPEAPEADAQPGPLPIAGLSLQAQRLTAFGQSLSGVRLVARAAGTGWKGSIVSDQAEGAFDWHDREDGALQARFKHLRIGTAEEPGERAPETAGEAESPRRLPALDVVAEQFFLRGMDLGRLELQARNRDGAWRLDALALAQAEGRLTGTGRWRPGADPVTELDFRLEADDIGRFLKRLGYPDAVVGGSAELTGNIDWRGAPTRIHYPTLSGALKLEARQGQFRRLDPGVGRLLGVLSLQSLPRRLTLDFRDVFSQGFAFDRISGSIDLGSGVLRTDDLQIRGPAARILMSGSADLEKETQDLRVMVQPTLSESVAIGAAAGLINPVAGVVTYFAQKALSDPIERLFAFNYEVTGSWADPRVEKLAAAPAPGQSPPSGARAEEARPEEAQPAEAQPEVQAGPQGRQE